MRVILIACVCIFARTEEIQPKKSVIAEVKVDRLVEAIMMVESGGDSLAYNSSEDAAGVLQIRPIMMREVNRILGKDSFTLKDRWSKAKSIAMFNVLRSQLKGASPEKVARTWNGGYREKKATLKYWAKVKKHIIKHKSPQISIIHQ